MIYFRNIFLILDTISIIAIMQIDSIMSIIMIVKGLTVK